MKRTLLLFLFACLCAGQAAAEPGTKKRIPLPYDYGNVVINNYSEKNGLAPVEFGHWLHRSKFTCRLCHVDLAFAMKAGSTGIKASDNANGYYCGACHNGQTTFGAAKLFPACSKTNGSGDRKRCERCHSVGKNVKREYDFASFTAKFPKERLGNGISWEKAEIEGTVKPVDYLEGISIKRKPLAVQKDFDLHAQAGGMPDIIFSHQKHTAWNGCELCHPDIFIGVKKGTTKYSMVDIYEGKYCGVCHSTVAFPMLDCQRCHAKPLGVAQTL